MSAMDQVVARDVERSEKQVRAAGDVLAVTSRLLTTVAELEPKVQSVVAAGSNAAQGVTAVSEAVKGLDVALTEATDAIRRGAKVELEQITHLAEKAKSLQADIEKAASAMASSALEMSGDVVKVKRTLVQSVDAIRRELDGGGG